MHVAFPCLARPGGRTETAERWDTIPYMVNSCVISFVAGTHKTTTCSCCFTFIDVSPLVFLLLDHDLLRGPLDPCVFQAAREGNMDILRYARRNGCPWNVLTCAYAAASGNLETLKWAREEEGCGWCVFERVFMLVLKCLCCNSVANVEHVKESRSGGGGADVDTLTLPDHSRLRTVSSGQEFFCALCCCSRPLLSFSRSRFFSTRLVSFHPFWAVALGPLRELTPPRSNTARKHPVWVRICMQTRSRNEATCAFAAAGGHVEVLKWARSKGCPWGEETCASAARGGRLKVSELSTVKR